MIKNRIDELLILRGILAILVFFDHSFELLFPDAMNSSALLRTLIPHGFQSVWCFFALSSFLLWGQLSKKNIDYTSFLNKRWRRLMPSIVITTVVFIGLNLYFRVLPFGSIYSYLTIVFPPLSFFYKFTAIASVNSVLWSVVIELLFILCLPFIYNVRKKIGLCFIHGLLVIWILVLLFLNLESKNIFPQFYGNPLYNLGFFLIGIYCFEYKNPKSFLKKYKKINISLCAAFFVFSEYVIESVSLNFVLLTFPVLFFISIFVLISSLDSTFQADPSSLGKLENLNIGKIFEKFGMLSYSIYLTHKPITYILLLGFSKFYLNWNIFERLLFYLATFFVVVGSSVLNYYLVESRFRLRK